MTVRPLRTPEGGPAPLRVISGGDRPRPRRAFLWALYTIGAVASFLALIYLRTAVDEAAYEIRSLENQIRLEEGRQNQLHLEKIRLESPGEIVPIAEHLLGMVLPDEVIPIPVVGVHNEGPRSVGSPGGVVTDKQGDRASETADGSLGTDSLP
ncbi:MAG: hypothetical protein OXS29_19120 [bacterium]|nr:hypothetical protein [bacterium]MDE0289018.1 hypothetical protein [bacterium]MDE0439505.1 hypothetical protein [bacterium]